MSYALFAIAWISTVLFSTPAFAGMVATPSGAEDCEAREALAHAVKHRAESLGAADRIPPGALAGASVTQLTMMLDAMNEVRAGYLVAVVLIVVICLAGIFLLSLLPGGGGGGEDTDSPDHSQHDTDPCSFCHKIGNGRCSFCGGDGWDEIYNLKCPRCSGGGNCYNCGGTGRVAK
jgi:hypothetical protein